MRCLHCPRNFEDNDFFKKHYAISHKINNYFSKKLFEKNSNKEFSIRKCHRCDEILISESDERIHNFTQHNQKGGNLPIESKPIKT